MARRAGDVCRIGRIMLPSCGSDCAGVRKTGQTSVSSIPALDNYYNAVDLAAPGAPSVDRKSAERIPTGFIRARS